MSDLYKPESTSILSASGANWLMEKLVVGDVGGKTGYLEIMGWKTYGGSDPTVYIGWRPTADTRIDWHTNPSPQAAIAIALSLLRAAKAAQTGVPQKNMCDAQLSTQP